MGTEIDFEQILPLVIRDYLPIGLKGLLIAGLLAAFMSTFAATVNAAPAYLVNDVYKRFINPNAPDKTYVRLSYVASLVVVLLGISFGFVGKSINNITIWIISALWAGYAAPNIMKWYWWRFNGFGFFWGMVSGIAAALISPFIYDFMVARGMIEPMHTIYQFPWIFLVSVIGCILGSLLTPPEEDEVLKSFFKTVKPWGFWGPVCQKVLADDPSFEKNPDFMRDCFNVLVGIVWQLSLTVIPLYLCIHENRSALYALVVAVITSVILKFTWYNNLEKEAEA
jgi:solute:Na+ symporter, SSS family